MFETQPILLRTLLDDVATGKLQLPDFQRGWVWDDDRIKEILVSISRGFPVGAIMTLSAGGDIRFKPRPIEGVENVVKDPEKFLLDGQQRLTSLYQALILDRPVKTQNSQRKRIERWYYIDMLKALGPDVDRDEVFVSVPENRQITTSSRRLVKDLSSPENEYQNHMMPTERLLDLGNSWVSRYTVHWTKDGVSHPHGNPAEFADEFSDKFRRIFIDYQLPAINLGTGTPKEAVCKVFEKVNTGGVTLTVFELVTASFAAEADDGFRLRDDWDARRQRMREKYGVLQRVEGEHFLQAIALVATNERRKQAISCGSAENQAPGINCRKDTVLNLSLDEYHCWADEVEKGFEEAAKFLQEQFIFRKNDVPYASQLVPLAALYVELGKELQSANAKTRLERWYWSGVFDESYGIIGTESQFARDVSQVAEYVREGNEPTLVTQASFIPERLLDLRTRNSAAYKGLYALQMKSGARDWRTGQSLTIATWNSNNIDIHHIFPKVWCQKQRKQIPPRLFNSIINKTPIDAQTNRIIGGRGPSEYIPRLEKEYIESKDLDSLLRTHWLCPELLRADDFAACFVERGVEMLELIGRAMEKPISDGRKVFQDALDSEGIEERQFIDDGIEEDEVGDVLRLAD